MISACPITALHDALLLLQSGRAGMAQLVLEGAVDAVSTEMGTVAWQAYCAGYAAGQRDAQQKPRQAPRKPSRLDRFRAALADPERRALVKATLRMDDPILERIAAGRAGLSSDLWRRLRDALA